MYVGLHPMIIFIMNESADYFLKYFYCFASKVQKNANYNYPEPKIIQFQWDVSCTYLYSRALLEYLCMIYSYRHYFCLTMAG